MPPISATTDPPRAGGGIVLIEVVLALAVLGLIAGLVLPHLPRTTGPATLRAKAHEFAAVLRQDRNAAIRRGAEMVSHIDLARRIVVSGADARTVRLPHDVRIDFVHSDREATGTGGAIRFYPDGRSSGGAVTFGRGRLAYRVQVNWLTAAVAVSKLENVQAAAD